MYGRAAHLDEVGLSFVSLARWRSDEDPYNNCAAFLHVRFVPGWYVSKYA